MNREERRKAGGGRVPAPRPRRGPAVLRPRGTRRLRGRQAGSEGGRAPPRAWAGPSAGGAGAPLSPSRGDSGGATAPSSVRALYLRFGLRAQHSPGGRCAEGPPPGAPLPDPASPLRVCACYSHGQSLSQRAAPANQAPEALGNPLRHQGHRLCCCGGKRCRRSRPRVHGRNLQQLAAIGGADPTGHLLRACEGVPHLCA